MKKLLTALISLLVLTGCNQVISDNSSVNKDDDEKESIDINDVDSTTDYNGISCTTLDLSSDVTIDDEGTYLLTGSYSNVTVTIDAGGSDIVWLILDNLNVSNDNAPVIYVKNAGCTKITLVGENTLSDSSTYKAIDDEDVDAIIYAKDDVIFNGDGTLNITANYDKGISAHDSLIIYSGTFNITSKGKAINVHDDLTIEDGTFNINSENDALHCKEGTITINGGTFNIASGDDAIHTQTTLTINGGTINVTSCVEGIEGQYIIINDGNVTVTASDDGLNARDPEASGNSMMQGEDASITINGGSIYVNSNGDGIDSNGDIYVNGGETIVYAQENGANAAFDYDGSSTITGGTLIAIGYSSMAQYPSTNNTQVAFCYNTSSTYQKGSIITISDSSGDVIYTIDSIKSFNSVVFSSADLVLNDTITIDINGTSSSLTLSSYAVGSSGMGGGGMNQGGMQGGGMQGGMQGGMKGGMGY